MTPDTVIAAVCGHYSLSLIRLRAGCRSRIYTLARCMVCALSVELTVHSLSDIAVALNVDHSSVSRAAMRNAERQRADARYARDLALIRRALEGAA